MIIRLKPRSTAPIFINLQRIFYGMLAVLVLIGCTRPASRPPVSNPTGSVPRISIERVQVNPSNGVYISGRGTLASGECVQTELLAGGRPVDWWPKNECVQIDTGQWEFLAAFGRNGAPEQLDEGVQYEVHAWWPKDPSVSVRFPFDLDGPASPP